MKVKVTNTFIDKYTGERYEVGKELYVKAERYDEIRAKGDFVEVIEEEAPAEKSLDKMTVLELKKYAGEHGVNIDGLTKKVELLAAINAAN